MGSSALVANVKTATTTWNMKLSAEKPYRWEHNTGEICIGLLPKGPTESGLLGKAVGPLIVVWPHVHHLCLHQVMDMNTRLQPHNMSTTHDICAVKCTFACIVQRWSHAM